jgi:hypothetical protein
VDARFGGPSRREKRRECLMGGSMQTNSANKSATYTTSRIDLGLSKEKSTVRSLSTYSGAVTDKHVNNP